MPMMVARVSELLFIENEHVHTVAYDRNARNVIKQFNIEGSKLQLAVGEEKQVFRALNNLMVEFLKKRNLDPRDFSFRVSHSDIKDGLFYECTFHTTIGSAIQCSEPWDE